VSLIELFVGTVREDQPAIIKLCSNSCLATIFSFESLNNISSDYIGKMNQWNEVSRSGTCKCCFFHGLNVNSNCLSSNGSLPFKKKSWDDD